MSRTQHQDDAPTRTVAQHMEEHHGWGGLHHDPALTAERHDAEHQHAVGQPESYSMDDHQDDHDALSDAS